MRMARLSVVFVACAALGLLASTASAVVPEFTVVPDKLQGKSGASVLEGAFTLKCTSSKITNGEVTVAKTTKGLVAAEGCTVAGFAANSEGDAAKTVLAEVTAELCYMPGSTKAAPKVGLYSTLPKNVKIESLGVKSEVTGAAIAEATPLNKKQLTGVGNAVKANPTECFPETKTKALPKNTPLKQKPARRVRQSRSGIQT